MSLLLRFIIGSPPLAQFQPEKNLAASKPGQCVGNPCDAGTGNKYQAESDHRSADSTLSITRSYNSQWAVDVGLGIGWIAPFNKRLEISGSVVQIRQAAGRGEPFTCINNTCTGDSDTTLALSQDASGYTLTHRDNSTERYDLTGKLLFETDNSGKTTNYGYDGIGRLSTVSNAFGHTLTFGYDASGHVVTVTDPSGQPIGYNYDASNNLTKVTYPDSTAKAYHYENTTYPNHLTGISFVDAAGAVTRYSTYAYDATGKAISTEHSGGQERFALAYDSATQTTVTDAANNKEVMTFSTNLGVKNLISKTNLADNKALTQTFDTNNNQTCKQDEEGRVTTYTYNAGNQKLSQTEGQGGSCSAPVPTAATRTTTYQYLAANLDLPTLIETPSVYAGSKKRVSISYDTQRNPMVITQSGYTPSGGAVARSVTLGYNTSGQVTSIDGPRSDAADVTTLDYNNCTTGGGCGQLRRVVNALGHVTSYDSYDANGRVAQVTDPNGLVTTYQYDPRGRVRFVTQGSRVTEYRYDAAGNVSFTQLPDSLTLTYTYDAANYLRRVTDSLGNHIDYGYDLKGNRTQTYTYDASGTLVRTVDLAFDARNRVSTLNNGGSITQQVRDALGNLVSQTDPKSNPATTHQYDALNRLFQTMDSLAGSTQYVFDANDRLNTVAAPNGATTQYSYDDLGNLLKEVSPDRGTLSYAYDAAGNVVQMTDARGIVTGYAYDALNRLTRIDYGSSVENVTYTYDSAAGCTFGLGRLCSVVDESGGTAYAYDAFGNQLVQTHVELGITYNTFYTYDAANRVTSITYPDNRVVSYTRDARGRITAVATSVNGTAVTLASARRFRPDGLLLAQSFGNGLNEVRQYDIKGQLTYQSLGSADTRVYGYDANGNLTGLQSLPLVGAYGYDALDRLNLDQRTTTATTSSAFTYDANGNRQSENLGSYAYLANSNRLGTTPSGSITLDAAGNTLSDGLRSYAYNNAGHVSTVAGAGYSYNAQRLRSRKIVGSQGTVYHYDLAGNLIAETDANGGMIRDIVWADAVPLAQIDRVLKNGRTPPPALPLGRLPAQATAERLTYLHTDHLDTPRLATDAQGQVVWRWEGTAFGDTAPTGSVVVNLRFPGQYHDSESGLLYNWNRYYDPRIGRYITSDPVGLRGGLNTYAYVGGNPLSFIDPSGLSQVLIDIQRTGQSTTSTMGSISVGSTAIGSTLERPSNNNNPNSSIPAGTYPARLKIRPSGERAIELTGVPGRSDVLIHIGNTPDDTTGCILPGKTASKDFVGDSATAKNEILKIIDDTQRIDAMSQDVTDIIVRIR